MISLDSSKNFGLALLCFECYYLLTFRISKCVAYSTLILQLFLMSVPLRLSPQYMVVELKGILRISSPSNGDCCFLIVATSCFRELWQQL